MPALVTPFKEDGKTINPEMVEKIMELHISQGANGFYILGGTGEGLVMSREDREVMCETAVKVNAGRKKIINHIAAMNLKEAIELAKHAERSGCDAIAAVPPCFFFYSSDDLYNYYKALANSVSIPLIIYYHPGAQKEMSAELIAHIFEIDNVTGVKWSSGDLFSLMRLKEMTHGEMNIINGPDELLISGLAAGADAGIGSTYNAMLPEFIKIYDLFRAGKPDEALKIQLKLNKIINIILKYEVIPSVKYMMKLLGYDCSPATFPMYQFDDEKAHSFEKEIRECGWLFC